MPLIHEVIFVSYQNDGYVLARIFIDLGHSKANVVERLPVGDVEDKYDAHGSLVEALGDDSELLLPCSVSDLHFNVFSVNFYHFASKLDGDCAQRVALELIFDVSVHH